MAYPRIDFLYLNEQEMIEAGVLDAARCIETMRDTMALFGKKDFLLGGPNADEHGLQMNFPQKSDIEGFPLDDGPDRRFADRIAFGAPVSTSERVTIRMDLGNPRAALWLLEP